MVESKQLVQFLEIVRQKSFRGAALKLNISQPALSRSIQRLEEELGAQLFNREKQGISLTDIGKVLLPKAILIVGSLVDTQQMIEQLKANEPQQLKVAFGPVYADLLGARTVGKFSARYPGVKIFTKVGNFTDMIEELDRGDVDLFIGESSTLSPQDKYRVFKLKKREGACCCRADHPLFALPHIGYEQIAQYPLLTPQLPLRLLPFATRAEDKVYTSKHSFFYADILCDSVGLAKQIVHSSDAVAILLKKSIEEEVARGELRIIETEQSTTDGALVLLAGKTPDGVVQNYLEIVMAEDEAF